MPRGLNRTDLNKTGTSYRNGTPITLPHEFGNPVTLPHEFGNSVNWTPDPAHFGNPVDWATPDPAHFGNIIGGTPSGNFILQADNTSKILLADLSGALLIS